jgi:hypothetical protein
MLMHSSDLISYMTGRNTATMCRKKEEL